MNINYLDKLEFNKIIDILSNYCITSIGKKISMELHPFNNKTVVQTLLAETTEALSLIYKKHEPEILPFSDINNIIHTLEINGTLNTKSLLEISKIFKISTNLRNYYYTDNDNSSSLFPTLEMYFSTLYSNPSIQTTIEKSILDEFTISDDASITLKKIRKNQRKLEETIKNKLDSFIHSSSYSKYIQESLITIRNDRYVIPVKEEYRAFVKGFIHDISSSGSTVFIEPIAVFELNNEMASLKALENIEIENILDNLSKMLYPYIEQLKTNIETIGKLDFIFAKAKYSINLNAIEPKINEEKYINLISARHPFIDKSTVVPIDINLGQSFSTLVITGPNTGGKTVTLKTVGLLTLMACSGLHIPANDNSSIFVFDNVYSDIGDEQSIQESLSTFSSHMKNIIEILKNCTKNSLVLLDELGSRNRSY